MSNHSGSHMLNEVLKHIINQGFLDRRKSTTRYEFIKNVLDTAEYYDCNNGEILENTYGYFKICYYCLKFTEKVDIFKLCAECGEPDSEYHTYEEWIEEYGEEDDDE